MKHGWKIFWILIAVITALGVICGCTALVLGVTFTDLDNAFTLHENTFITEESVDILESASEQYEFQNITDLDISVGACEVVIQKSNIATVLVDASRLNYQKLGLELNVEEDQGTLVIQTRKNGNLWDVFSAKNKNGGLLKVYIPENSRLSTADFSFGACNIDISGLTMEEMNLKLGAADCEMEEMDIAVLHAEVGAGELEYAGTISEKAEIECGVGEVDLHLDGRETDFNYDLSVGIGEIEIEENSYGGLAVDKVLDYHANKNMTIECGAGSVSVDFK